MNRSTAIQTTRDAKFCVNTLKNSLVEMRLLAESLWLVLPGLALYLLPRLLSTDQKASSANPSGGTSTLPLTESEVGRWEGPLARRLF